MEKEKIDWKEYHKNLLGSLSNERLRSKAVVDGFNPHLENISSLKNEIENIEQGNYDEIINLHTDTPDYFDDFLLQSPPASPNGLCKEQKINMLLALLTSTIWEDTPKTTAKSSPYVCFLSSTEVQTAEGEGYIPTNRVYKENTLKDLLGVIVNTYFEDEKRHWLESWSTDHPTVDFSGIEDVYDSTYYPDHIYHKLRTLKELIA